MRIYDHDDPSCRQDITNMVAMAYGVPFIDAEDGIRYLQTKHNISLAMSPEQDGEKQHWEVIDLPHGELIAAGETPFQAVLAARAALEKE